MSRLIKLEKKSNEGNETVRQFISVYQDEDAWHDSPRGWSDSTRIVWSSVDRTVDEYEDTLNKGKDEVLKTCEGWEDYEELNDIITTVKNDAPKGSYCQKIRIDDYRQEIRISAVGKLMLVSSLKKLKHDHDGDYFSGIMYTTKECKGREKHHALAGDIETFDLYCRGDVYVLMWTKEEKCQQCGHWDEKDSNSIGGIYGNGQYGDAHLEALMDQAADCFNIKKSDWDIDGADWS